MASKVCVCHGGTSVGREAYLSLPTLLTAPRGKMPIKLRQKSYSAVLLGL